MRKISLVLFLFSASTFATCNTYAGQILATPSGLSAGDHFRFIFHTSSITDASSSDIATYDTFVNTDAAGATYNGATIHWSAIGSTAAVNAITHIGVTGDAVYLPDGIKVANSDSTSGLWSGTLLHKVNEIITGAISEPYAWTGTDADGTGVSGSTLGTANPVLGVAYSANSWWTNIFAANSAYANSIYGISDELTVPGGATVPEPSTAMLAGLGGAIGVAISFFRKQNERHTK